jgi:hypothetical protein
MGNKRLDLLAKYFADLSKISFSAVIVKQFLRTFNLTEFIIELFSALVMIVVAYFLQPKE